MSTTTRARPAPASSPTAAKTPRIHPRFRQRRVAVKKEEGRRRLRWVLWGAGLAGALAGAWALSRGPLLDVDEVRATGAERTLLDDVIEAGGLEHGRAMIDIDPAGSERSIEALPWVAEAVVERRWPGSVVVRVSERAPVVGLSRGGTGWALADRDGRVLAWQDGPPAGLPHVHDARRVPPPGEKLSGPTAGAADVAAQLPGSLRAVVGGVNLRGNSVELALTGGGVVRIGSPARQVPEKLRAAATVLKRVGPQVVAVLDVSVPRAPVLARKAAPAPRKKATSTTSTTQKPATGSTKPKEDSTSP
jgi:cell division protein FtsQ